VRADRVEPRFVEFVPEVLEDGVLYISIAYGAVVHRCYCGCGEKVSTPLSPAQWKFTYDGETVSLSPSVGSGTLPCNSHYLITRNQVQWAVPLTRTQTAAALRQDRSAVADHYEAQKASERRSRWLGRLRGWFRR
jgi:hypothetical protein